MLLGVAAAVVGDEIVDGDVEIEDGMVSRVGVPNGKGSGLAVPGFIDVHLHGYSGVDFARDDAEALASVSRTVTESGVTAFRPTLMSMGIEETTGAIRRHSEARWDGARILGLHLEGPFLSPSYPGAHPPGCLIDPDLDVTTALLAAGDVAHMTIAPELPGALEVIEFLVERGLTVALGHSDAAADVAHRGFDLGATVLTHVFNGSRPLGHRDPGIIGAALSRPDVHVEAILDGVHLSDEASVVVMRAAGRRLVAVTDAMAAAGNGEGSYTLGNQQVEVRDGEARLADGTLACSVLTMDRAFIKLLELGADVVAAARATSTAPAEVIGQPELGVLAPGTRADLVILDHSHQVEKTLVAGVVRYPA